MSLQQIEELSLDISIKEKKLRSLTDYLLKEQIELLFAIYPDIQCIEWAQKYSEYNDEGMYPGVYGPVVDQTYDEDESFYWPDWLGWGGKGLSDSRLTDLHNILHSAGADVLSDLYGDEHRVTIKRDDTNNFRSEYNGC